MKSSEPLENGLELCVPLTFGQQDIEAFNQTEQAGQSLPSHGEEDVFFNRPPSGWKVSGAWLPQLVLDAAPFLMQGKAASEEELENNLEKFFASRVQFWLSGAPQKKKKKKTSVAVRPL